MTRESLRGEYFAHAHSRIRPGRLEEVRRAIKQEGHWEEVEEACLHAFAERRIEPVERSAVTLYYVRVSIDLTFECFCPNLERAVQFLDVFDVLAVDLFQELGRPSVPAPTTG